MKKILVFLFILFAFSFSQFQLIDFPNYDFGYIGSADLDGNAATIEHLFFNYDYLAPDTLLVCQTNGTELWRSSWGEIFNGKVLLIPIDNKNKHGILFLSRTEPLGWFMYIYQGVSVDVETNKANFNLTNLTSFQNLPNPVNSTAEINIKFTLSKTLKTKLSIFDATGKKIRTLIDATQPAGQYNLVWDKKDKQNREVSAGTYFYLLDTDEGKKIKQQIIVK